MITYSLLQLVSEREPNLSHLKIIGCVVYVPIPPTSHQIGIKKTTGHIYIGFYSPSIIEYLQPSIDYIFTALYADCQFDEKVFPVLGGDNNK